MAAIELGCFYYVYNPSSSQYFCLNDPTDPSFVGYVSDITGIDSAGVRENAQQKSAASGGYHGPFWADRRPWTISGFIFPTTPLSSRSAAQNLMQGILMQCLQEDGYLTWIPSDGIQKVIAFRNQQPYRSTKGQSNVERNFLISGVAADWRIFSQAVSNAVAHGATGGGNAVYLGNLTNEGNADSPFSATISGPINGFTIANTTTGKNFVYNAVVPQNQQVVVDFEGTYPSVVFQGVDASGFVNPTTTDWTIAVAPGNNTFVVYDNELTEAAAANNVTEAQIEWYSGAWA
jgi:hypothetical protein